jgi:hypothetical protein
MKAGISGPGSPAWWCMMTQAEVTYTEFEAEVFGFGFKILSERQENT